MPFFNDITLMSCHHDRSSPRCSIDRRGVCVSCGDQPDAHDTTVHIENLTMSRLLLIDNKHDVQRGVIYK